MIAAGRLLFGLGLALFAAAWPAGATATPKHAHAHAAPQAHARPHAAHTLLIHRPRTVVVAASHLNAHARHAVHPRGHAPRAHSSGGFIAASRENRLAVVVVDAETGAVLRAEHAGDPWYPASLTKMMTALMAFDAIDNGRLQVDDNLWVSSHAAAQQGSRLGLRTGDVLSVDTALRSLFVRSANDSSVALAERISGSEAAFASAMTAKAYSIGMYHSHFHNATGLPDPQQITTAHDMAVLAYTLMHRYARHSHYYQAEEMVFRRRNLGTVNTLLKVYPGAEGMKTGFTCASGYNIVAAAHRNDRHLIAVYLGGGSRNQRTGQVSQLLDQGFEDNRPFQQLTRLGDPSLMQASLSQPIHRLDCGENFDAPSPVGGSDDEASPVRPTVVPRMQPPPRRVIAHHPAHHAQAPHRPHHRH